MIRKLLCPRRLKSNNFEFMPHVAQPVLYRLNSTLVETQPLLCFMNSTLVETQPLLWCKNSTLTETQPVLCCEQFTLNDVHKIEMDASL